MFLNLGKVMSCACPAPRLVGLIGSECRTWLLTINWKSPAMFSALVRPQFLTVNSSQQESSNLPALWP